MVMLKLPGADDARERELGQAAAKSLGALAMLIRALESGGPLPRQLLTRARVAHEEAMGHVGRVYPGEDMREFRV